MEVEGEDTAIYCTLHGNHHVAYVLKCVGW